MPELHTVESRDRFPIGMIAEDQRNRAVKLTGLLSLQDIHQAVKVLRHEDGDPGNVRHQLQAPVHPKFRGRGLEFGPECVQVESIQRPFDAHKEQAGFVVLMLIGMYDVGAVSIEQAGDGRDQAFTVRTIDQENRRIPHGSEVSLARGAGRKNRSAVAGFLNSRYCILLVALVATRKSYQLRRSIRFINGSPCEAGSGYVGSNLSEQLRILEVHRVARRGEAEVVERILEVVAELQIPALRDRGSSSSPRSCE